MQGRSTVYNKITTPEKIKAINPNNWELVNDFLDYLASVDRSPKTIKQYEADLKIFFVYVLDFLNNKPFIEITKREMARFQNHAINVYKWSPKRTRRVKSVISSLSNYIENMLDEEEEFKNYRSIIRKIESPADEPVREKTIISEEQIKHLFDTLVERKEYERATAVAILAYSGMRKGELLQMKMEYFNPDHLEFGCLYKTDKIRTKGRGVRGKQMNKYIMSKVDKYLDMWRKQREELGVDSEWMFVVEHDGKWEQRPSVEHWKSEFTEILGVPFYYHSLRHMLCTDLNSQNIPAEVIREFFGWDSAEMIKIYNDSSAVDDFAKYFNADGVVSQDVKKINDIE